MCGCGCSSNEWFNKPIYKRVWDNPHSRYFCDDTISIWQRIYCADSKGRYAERAIAYLWLASPTSCCCTCGTCSGWRGV